MIGSIALSFINSAWGRYIGIAFAALAALSVYGRGKRRAGRREQHAAQVKFTRERTDAGTKAFHEARRANTGRDVESLLAQMSANDKRWERLPDLH